MGVILTELATIIRSKNAGPYVLTLDIFFKDQDVFQRVVRNGMISHKLIAELYHVDTADVLSIIPYEPANAIKINIRRRVSSGDALERDVYGAQQHAPLLSLQLALE